MSSTNRGIHRQQPKRKSVAGDEFFGIDDRKSSAHWSLHLLAGVFCVIFAWWVWMLNPIPNIHGDQMNVVTMVLSKEHPDNFARDIVWGRGGKVADFYPFLSRMIVSGLIKKFGVIGGHRAAQFPLSIAYLFVMYGTLYYLIRSVPAALLVSLASMIWRWSMAETYWGLDRLQAVQSRSLVLICIPVLFILFWKLRNSWRLLIPFFITGLLFNLNPSSVLNFAALSLSSLFLISLFDRNTVLSLRDRILRLFCAGGIFIVGALPFLYTNMVGQDRSAVELSGRALQEHTNALQYLLNQISWYPDAAGALAKSLLFGFSVPLLLATIAWCFRKERRNMFDKWLLWFFLLSFVGTVVAEYTMQRALMHLKVDPFLPNRGQKFAYLVMYIYIAWFLAELLGRSALRERCVLVTVAAAVVAIMPVFGNNSRDPVGQWRYNAVQAGILLRGEKIEIAGWHAGIAKVCAWARQKTPKDSLFLFVHRFMSPFRIYALRSLVSSEGSGGMAYYSGHEVFATWAKYQQQLERITASRDVSRLLSLADESRADYIIVPNDFPKVTGWALAMRDRFWTVYKRP